MTQQGPTFWQDILPDLDDIRGIADELGLRRWKVFVRRRTWTGKIPGDGIKSDVDTQIVNSGADNVDHPVRVQQLSRKDVVASGGLYADRDIKVGPITPAYAASMYQGPGGYTDAILDPAPTGQAVEIFWYVQGPGWPAPSGLADKVGEEVTALHYYVILRSTGRNADPPTQQQPATPPANPVGDMQLIEIPIGTAASYQSNTVIPAGAVVERSYVNITTAYPPGTTILVGQGGSTSLLMTGLDSSPNAVGLYDALQRTPWGGLAMPGLVTVVGSPAFGAGVIGISYSLPQS